MKRIGYLALPTLAFLAFSGLQATAQQSSLKQEIVGTWVVDKSILHRSSGDEDVWGPGVTGHYVYGADGSYTQVLLGSKDAAMKPSDVRDPDAHLVALIGSYTVDADGKTVRIKVRRGSNSVRDGAEQVNVVTLKGDQMTTNGSARNDAKGSFEPVQTLRRYKQ